MYNKEQKNDENFWISYADLMAGLLFVFILVIGAIIIKYLYTQNDLQVIKTNLEKEKQALNMSEEELSNKKKKLDEINEKLKIVQDEKVHLSFELAKAKNIFDETKTQLEKEKELAKNLSEELDKKNALLQLSNEQITKITSILEDKNNNIELLNKNLREKSQAIKLNLEEMEKLKALLLGYELKNKEQENENINLKDELANRKNLITLKDEELAMLEEKLLIQSKEHQKLVEEFDITKVKIKHLTGIKINVISKLREKLGKSINIDEKSGAIKFSSNILFDQGQYKLKEESKKELSQILKKYLSALLEDETIKQYIHSITIEGHTNSDGTYLSNLQLSQKRALEVMEFLYESNIINKDLISKYINSSGRSSSDIIYKNGVEDKDNSRRIEIKFTVKNESAIKELQNFLGEAK